MSAAALDPAEAMSTAITDAYDQLRQLVEKFAGRRDDPQLLEEVGAVRRRALGRYNRAKKKAEPPAAEPATASTTRDPEKPADRPHAAEPTAVRPAAAAPPAAPKVAPATIPPERVSVRLARVPWWVRRPQLVVVALILLGAAAIVVTGNPLVVLGGGAAVAELVRVSVPRLVRRRVRAGGAR